MRWFKEVWKLVYRGPVPPERTGEEVDFTVGHDVVSCKEWGEENETEV